MRNRLLRSGVPYKKLRLIWVIIITPVDLFGKNRMVYTFENRCIEDPELSLQDGAKRLFLYSKGETGREETLYQLLQYIECSHEENAVNPETRSSYNLIVFQLPGETVSD